MGLNQSKKKNYKKNYKKFENNRIFPRIIKIVLLGDVKVGKTSICNSFVKSDFKEEYLPTIALDKLEKKQLLNNGKEIMLKVFDISGEERFRSAALKTVKLCHGIVLVFDVTNRKSFDNLGEWLKLIYEYYDKPFIILFGNKADAYNDEWTVDREEIEEFAKKERLKYFEISAKNGKNINEGFSYLVNEIYPTIESKMNDKICDY